MKTAKEILIAKNPIIYDEITIGDIRQKAIVDINLDAILEAMKEYARLACEEQKKICAKQVELGFDPGHGGGYYIKENSILNAPLPNLE